MVWREEGGGLKEEGRTGEGGREGGREGERDGRREGGREGGKEGGREEEREDGGSKDIGREEDGESRGREGEMKEFVISARVPHTALYMYARSISQRIDVWGR